MDPIWKLNRLRKKIVRTGLTVDIWCASIMHTFFHNKKSKEEKMRLQQSNNDMDHVQGWRLEQVNNQICTDKLKWSSRKLVLSSFLWKNAYREYHYYCYFYDLLPEWKTVFWVQFTRLYQSILLRGKNLHLLLIWILIFDKLKWKCAAHT